jgi:hypothetical protein
MITDELLFIIQQEALANNLEPAALQAVVSIESSGQPFWTVDGEQKPVMRYEGHYFYARLKGDKLQKAIKEGLASPKVGGVANPSYGSGRYALLARAMEIDHEAALESCSWGLGQVMGANWKDLGYSSVDALVDEANTEAGQIDMMIKFIQHNNLVTALQSKDWKKFARGYNGPKYGTYDQQLAKAYKAFSNPVKHLSTNPDTQTSLPLDEVSQLQTMLNTVGDYKLTVDGKMGTATSVAIRDFQLKNNLMVDGIYGKLTKEVLTKAYLDKSKKHTSIFGAGAASLGVGGTMLSEAAKSIQDLTYTSQIIQFIFIGLVVIGTVFTVYALIKKGQS